MQQYPLSPSHGHPGLWTSHFLRHLCNISSLLVDYIFSHLGSSNGPLDESVLRAGFRIPDLPEVHRAHENRFANDTLRFFFDIPRVGCPTPLRNLLKEDFQIWEDPHHFERYRIYRGEDVAYEKVPFSDKLLDSLFEGKCTRSLGDVVQPRYFCRITNTVICRAHPIIFLD
jgi:hypothetical protein